MKPTMTRRAVTPTVAVVTMLLAAWAFAPEVTVPEAPELDPVFGACEGIHVVQDGWAMTRTGHRGAMEPRAVCAATDVPMTARAAYRAIDSDPVRTPDGAVCRVEGAPDEIYAIARPGGGVHVETCETTPPHYARWVLWHHPADGGWTDEEQDVEALVVAPGDTVALVWTYLGEPAAPGYAPPRAP